MPGPLPRADIAFLVDSLVAVLGDTDADLNAGDASPL
jgi:hypothetical protein